MNGSAAVLMWISDGGARARLRASVVMRWMRGGGRRKRACARASTSWACDSIRRQKHFSHLWLRAAGDRHGCDLRNWSNLDAASSAVVLVRSEILFSDPHSAVWSQLAGISPHPGRSSGRHIESTYTPARGAWSRCALLAASSRVVQVEQAEIEPARSQAPRLTERLASVLAPQAEPTPVNHDRKNTIDDG